MTTIGESVFYDCKNLKEITITNSVTEIGTLTVYGCESLKHVYCKAITPPWISFEVFNENDLERKIYVPSEAVEAYKSADGWNKYADAIVGYDFDE